MKRLLPLVFSVLFVVALAACGEEVASPQAGDECPHCAVRSARIVGDYVSLPYVGDIWASTWAADDTLYAAFGDATGMANCLPVLFPDRPDVEGIEQAGLTETPYAPAFDIFYTEVAPGLYTVEEEDNEYCEVFGCEEPLPLCPYTPAGLLALSGEPPTFEPCEGPDQCVVGRHIPYGDYRVFLQSDKPSSVLAVEERLYMAMHAPPGQVNVGYLAYSDDGGRTWQRVPGSPWRDGSPFQVLMFVNMGRGYALNRDGYAYALAIAHELPNDAQPQKVYLARAPLPRGDGNDPLLDYAAYEYFVGLDEGGEPRWSRDPAEAVPLDGLETIAQGAAAYHPGVRQYLFLSGFRDPGGLGTLFAAPNPWGPWYKVADLPMGFIPGIIPKGMSETGFYFTASGGPVTYNLNVGRIEMEVDRTKLFPSEMPPPTSVPAERIVPARTPVAGADIPPLKVPAPAPIRPGCGDYRLLVTVETDAVTAGVHVQTPEDAVQLGWRLSGPGLAYHEPPLTPFAFYDEGTFFIDANDDHQALQARFLLLVTGVQPGQTLTLELGQVEPGEGGTRITIANTVNGWEQAGPTLFEAQVEGEYQAATLDLCAAEPMPLPTSASGTLSPRLLAFYYQWWRSEEGYECGEDPYAWRRELDGRLLIVSAHTPIFQDGDEVIYRETRCWRQVTDDAGRTGWIYDQNDTRFVAEQMALAKAYGLDGFAVSVNGDEPREVRFLAEAALSAAEGVGFLIAPLYEPPNSGWEYDLEADIRKVGGHLRDVLQAVGRHPALLTVPKNGEEAVVVFVDGVVLQRFPDPRSWAAIRAITDEAGVPYVLWSGPGEEAWVFESGFEGIYHDLDVEETQEPLLGLPPYALRDRRRLAYRASAWAARERGLPLALPVVLGWEANQALVTEEEYVPLPRDYGAPGDMSAYYRARWEDALEQVPDWIVVTSWNEWAEGTELEPSDTYPPSRFDYLQATWTYRKQWAGGAAAPSRLSAQAAGMTHRCSTFSKKHED